MADLEPQIFGAIIGAAATVLLCIVVLIITNIWTDKRQQRQHKHEIEKTFGENMREKLEKAYLSFSKWNIFFSSMYIAMIPYVQGEVSEIEASEYLTRGGGAGLMEEVEMLLHLYFPELKDEYDKVMEERANVVNFFPINGKSPARPSDFFSAQKAYEKRVSYFKDKFKKVAKEL